jgi:hypothetical protein
MVGWNNVTTDPAGGSTVSGMALDEGASLGFSGLLGKTDVQGD